MTNENIEYTPQLTLTPQQDTPSALSLNTVQNEGAKRDVATNLEMEKLTSAEQKAVMDFAQKIDIRDTNVVLQYGAGAQQNIAAFSSNALESVRTKDMGEAGEMLTNLVGQLKGFSGGEEKKGIFGVFKKASNQIANLKTQYNSAEANVNKIVEVLEKHQITLLKDTAMLDKMYEVNQAYFKELSMYILAGKQRLKAAQEEELPALTKKAEESGLPEDAQAANDFANMCNRFEKKIHDLELTRIISIQMAPQIRLIQNNDSLMVEKIQTSIVNTIPLWKSQMVLALGMAHSQQAMQAQRDVTDVTNRLLRENAEKLKTGSIEIAKEAERSIVDLETLQHTNRNLIETLEQVRQIQIDGSKQRAEAEVELGRIENELKTKLLEMKGR